MANFSGAFQNNISAWEALVNASYLSIYNATYELWAYNHTTQTFNLYNSTWDQSNLGVYAYNHTIETFNLYNSTWSYGLNPFNQTLNTTDDVRFNKLNVSGFDSSFNNNIFGSYYLKWLDSTGSSTYAYTMGSSAGYVLSAVGVPLSIQYGNVDSLIGAYMNESGYWNFTQPAHFNNVNPLTTLTYDLGSGAERWNWLYVRNISTEYLDVLNALSFDGNITAGYIFANGSELTSVCLQNGSNCVASGGDYYLANYSGSFQTNITDWETKVNDSYLSIFNITYNNLLNQQCPSGQVLNGTYSNGTFSCISVTSLGGDYYLANFSEDFQRNITDWETRVNSTYL